MVGANIRGFTVAQTMSVNGVRQSTASAFLRPIRNRANLDIVLNATATRILINNQKRVTGVEYLLVSTFVTVLKIKQSIQKKKKKKA